ncbi:uncharacterized transmembrane protein DDB_G0289901-like, partial [Sitodiplosis mosellana]|uniref:uncharacterized transmembrane protein DDB_G0289901-like n=1 Tax=Sitodiplosis mosellana TaxID=263140 RepID=UPI00244523E3
QSEDYYGYTSSSGVSFFNNDNTVTDAVSTFLNNGRVLFGTAGGSSGATATTSSTSNTAGASSSTTSAAASTASSSSGGNAGGNQGGSSTSAGNSGTAGGGSGTVGSGQNLGVLTVTSVAVAQTAVDGSIYCSSTYDCSGEAAGSHIMCSYPS